MFFITENVTALLKKLGHNIEPASWTSRERDDMEARFISGPIGKQFEALCNRDGCKAHFVTRIEPSEHYSRDVWYIWNFSRIPFTSDNSLRLSCAVAAFSEHKEVIGKSLSYRGLKIESAFNIHNATGLSAHHLCSRLKNFI